MAGNEYDSLDKSERLPAVRAAWAALTGAEPKLRSAGNKKELLVPVKFTGGKATITQEFVW